MKIGWLDAFEYRTEFFIGYLGWFVSLIISVFIWRAVAEGSGGTIGNYNLTGLITYLLIIQILRTFVFSRSGFTINQDIQRGELSNWLMRPVSYLKAQFVIELANNVLRGLMGIVIFGVLILLYNPDLLKTFTTIKILGSIGFMLLGHTISFLLITVVALSAFWVTNANRFLFIYFSFLTIFSGMIIPLDLFPARFLPYISNSPLAYIFYHPAKYIQSGLPSDALIPVVWHGILYLAILILVVSLIYLRGLRRYEAVGK